MIDFVILKIGNLVIAMIELAISCMIGSLILESRKAKIWEKLVGAFLFITLVSIPIIFVGPSFFQTVVSLIAIFIYHSIVFKGSVAKRLEVIFLVMVATILSDVVSYFLFYNLLPPYAENTLQYKTYWTLTGVGAKVISFMMIDIVCRIINRKEYAFKPTEAIVHLSPLISIYVIRLVINCIVLEPRLSFQDALDAVIASIGLLVVNVFTWKVFDKVIEQQKEQQTSLMIQEKLKQQYEYYRNQELRHEEVRRLKHDLKHHLQCVNDLLYQGHIEEAKDYLRPLRQNVLNVFDNIATGNLIMDTVLSDKYRLALDKQIRMSIKMQGTENIKLDDMDLCTIYSNLLDNAIEACEKVEISHREILVVTQLKYDFITILVENTKQGKIVEKEGRYVTTKENKGLHGLGIINVKEVVNKYQGKFHVAYDDESFRVKIIIPNS